jgi:hypothetical protein
MQYNCDAPDVSGPVALVLSTAEQMLIGISVDGMSSAPALYCTSFEKELLLLQQVHSTCCSPAALASASTNQVMASSLVSYKCHSTAPYTI